MKAICICGGGNLGLVCAAVFASRGVRVNMLTGHPADWNSDIRAIDREWRVYSGHVHLITDSPEAAVRGVDAVLLCVPGFRIEPVLRQIEPYVDKNIPVGSVVSSTGFFEFAGRILGEDACLFGFQRVPYIARATEYGKTGMLLGYKPLLCLSIENCRDPESLRKELISLFNNPIRMLRNRYEASLTNSNPLLHTSRLYSLLSGRETKPLDNEVMFYADWTIEASRLLIAMDKEFMQLTSSLGIGRDAIPSILEYYESTDAESLTAKLQSIEAFKELKLPVVETERGLLPDYGSRYFTEDFRFGLRYIVELAEKRGIPHPLMRRVYDWGLKLAI